MVKEVNVERESHAHVTLERPLASAQMTDLAWQCPAHIYVGRFAGQSFRRKGISCAIYGENWL